MIHIWIFTLYISLDRISLASQLRCIFTTLRRYKKLKKYFNLSFNDREFPRYAGKSSRSVFRFAIPRRREDFATHRAEETGATSKTRRPATSPERAGSKVKTIAYNWHMKFKGGLTRRTGGKAGGSLNTPAVFEPLFFSPSFRLAGNLHFLPAAGTVCLSRFLLKSRWWLCSPSPTATLVLL